MESISEPERLGFCLFRARLLHLVNFRINSGEFTERGLARRTGISQPQMHNVLKGVRNLTVETADTLLAVLEISIPDLLTAKERARLLSDPEPLYSPPPALRKPAAREASAPRAFYKRAG